MAYLPSDDEATINLTPLIDVVFVVLIMFMIIAPILDVDQVKLATGAPQKVAPSNTPEPGKLTIHVRADNTIWIRNTRVLPEKLLLILQQERRKGVSLAPQLFQDKRAAFGTYQEVKNAVEMAGFAELDVILQPG